MEKTLKTVKEDFLLIIIFNIIKKLERLLILNEVVEYFLPAPVVLCSSSDRVLNADFSDKPLLN